MKERKKLKWLLLMAVTAIMLMASAVSVSAATYNKAYKDIIVKKGKCYHFFNNNISKNKVSKYTLQVIPRTSSTNYDIVYSNQGQMYAAKSCRTKRTTVSGNTYIKPSTSSNYGLISCLSVSSGSVAVRIKFTTTYKNAKLNYNPQSSSHKPLKLAKVTKGRWVYFKKSTGNSGSIPLVLGARTGAAMQRTVNSSRVSYETYFFNKSSLLRTVYKKNKKSYTQDTSRYESTSGKYRYKLWLFPGSYTGVMRTLKGTINYYYPSDCLTVKGWGGAAKS